MPSVILRTITQVLTRGCVVLLVCSVIFHQQMECGTQYDSDTTGAAHSCILFFKTAGMRPMAQ